MKSLFKHSITICLFVFFFSSSQAFFLEEENDIDFSDINLDEISLDESTPRNKHIENPLKVPTIQGIALFLSNYVKQPLWTNTKAPTGRNLLYLFPFDDTKNKKTACSAHLFYNQTYNMQVTVGDFFPDEAIEGKEEIVDLVMQNI